MLGVWVGRWRMEDGIRLTRLQDSGVPQCPGALGGSCSSWSFFLPPGPLPMEAIEKMARLCMRDLDEDEEGTDEDDVEADEDLLVSTGLGQAIPSQCPGQQPRLPTLAMYPCRQS